MIKPAAEYILVEPITRGEQRRREIESRSALLVPDPPAEGPPNMGVVYAIGSDISLDISVGETVVFREDSPKGFEWEGVKLFPLRAEQILAKIQEPKK